jgi:two-component system chemotaxis response regulator CheY
MRALVIDDSKPIRLILTKILQDQGFEVQEAANGLEALDVLKTEKIDLALVDWNMPEMDGHEFIIEVRKHSAYQNMLMMMVTTETAIERIAEALESGANEYIMKPFTKEMIAQKLSLMGIIKPEASE